MQQVLGLLVEAALQGLQDAPELANVAAVSLLAARKGIERRLRDVLQQHGIAQQLAEHAAAPQQDVARADEHNALNALADLALAEDAAEQQASQPHARSTPPLPPLAASAAGKRPNPAGSVTSAGASTGKRPLSNANAQLPAALPLQHNAPTGADHRSALSRKRQNETPAQLLLGAVAAASSADDAATSASRGAAPNPGSITWPTKRPRTSAIAAAHTASSAEADASAARQPTPIEGDLQDHAAGPRHAVAEQQAAGPSWAMDSKWAEGGSDGQFASLPASNDGSRLPSSGA